MSTQNDNEFENVFKRSAENYPLKTDNSDWGYVLSKLEEKEEKKGFLFRRKSVLILLALLAVGIVSSVSTGLIMHYLNNKQTLSAGTTVKTKPTEPETKQEKKITEDVYKKVIDSIKHFYPVLKADKKEPLRGQLSDNKTAEGKKKTNIQPAAKKPITEAPEQIAEGNSAIAMQNTAALPKTRNTVPLTDTDEKNKQITAITKTDGPTDSVKMKQPELSTQAPQADSSAIAKPTKELIVNTADTGIIKRKPSKEKNRIEDGRFYLGLLYANDKSSIRLEPTKGMGYSWSFTAGYRLSKKLSIESGVHIEKKEYYALGDNFNNKSILPASGRILWVESENKLIEIPIALKADLLRTRRHNFFASLGVSSYLVNQEFFEYEEEINGVLHDGSVLFTNNTSNLFATTNITFGYQYKFGKIGSFRIEPYLNLPIRGIGKGKEQIISRGINFGWIYEFQKRTLKH